MAGFLTAKMQSMRKVLAFLVFIPFITPAPGQNSFDASYQSLRSGSFVQDKNFYLFTLLENLPQVNKAWKEDPELINILEALRNRNKNNLEGCLMIVDCWIKPLQFTEEEEKTISQRITVLAEESPAIRYLVEEHMRPSGKFMKYQDQPNGELLLNAWKEAYAGMQYIIDAYAYGNHGRYPAHRFRHL